MRDEPDTSDAHIGRGHLIGPMGTACTVAARMGSRLNAFGLLHRAFKLKDAFLPNFALLFAHVLLLNREGPYVPTNNEYVYLLYLAKLWNPDFLANDWTFSGGLPSHLVFNFFFGPLTLVFPLVVVGWIGRILCWSFIIIALLQLGKHFRIPRWMITVSIFLWLFYQQSIVGGEWVLGTFEAKCIAYALLFFALNGFVQQRVILPSILLGLTVSFHPLVGLWAALAVGLSFLALRLPVGTMLTAGTYTALFALPGLIPLLLTSHAGGSESAEIWKFLALVVIPYHFDPYYFGRNKLLLLLLAMLLGFNWLYFRASGKSSALRLLLAFQMFLGLFFVVGFLARFTENYKFLILMPCRLFPVFVPLFFFLSLLSVLHQCSSIKGGKSLVAVGLLMLAAFGNPITLFVDRMTNHYDLWTRQEEDVLRAFRWIASNTPADSVIISPPWRGESFYLTRRAQIASWWLPRFDRLTEWRERLESLGGDVSSISDGTTRSRMQHMEAHYHQLTATEVALLVEKYGAEYLVSLASYNYPVLLNSGTYKVYRLRKDDPAGSKH